MNGLSSTIFLGFFGFGKPKDTSNTDSKASKPKPRNISAREAKAVMDKGEPYTLVDVRSGDEFSDGHIKGAILIPVDEIGSRAETKLPDKNAVILVYCASGARSSRASKILAGMGYTNVNNFGGIMGWPYGTVSG